MAEETEKISQELPKEQHANGISQILTPSPSTHSSEETSPIPDAPEEEQQAPTTTQKKKKKKKSKKSAKAKEAAAAKAKADSQPSGDSNRPPVLCISRNKHWRYISSYHGPWLQLPLELLESLLVLNLDPATLASPESRPPLPSPTSPTPPPRPRGFQSLSDHSPPDSPRGTFATLPPPPPIPTPKAGKATPPPIDPGVFRSVTSIRRLIDEAAELSVRASSGLSAAALGSMRGGGSLGMNSSPWATAQSLGLNPMGEPIGGGRNVAMSAMRVHRLRALAVQKLAQAYKADEIASSVMVMQGGSVFDDVAERVLKTDPNDPDARYVHFFHEKIPSRQLAESTTTQVLDELIAAQPQRLELYRTRGIVHCFRDEYSQATKDFTFAIKEARAARKAKMSHHTNGSQTETRTKGPRKKKNGGKSNGQAPPNGTSAPAENSVEGPDGEPVLLHPSVLPDAPDPIEPQLLFLRGAAYLQHAIFLIEEAVLNLEGVRKLPSIDGAELRLCYIENGKYGGVEIGNPDGPLGSKDGAKFLAYRSVLADENFREQITSLLKKAIRDHERFLSHFDTLEGHDPTSEGNLAQKTEYAFLLSESIRPGNQGGTPHILDPPSMFTTYHPLLVESHFSILICQLMLVDTPRLLPTFARTAALVDGLEGYPVFLPPRSMSQAEFIEVLERLAGGWRAGVQPHSLSPQGVPGMLTIEGPSTSSITTISESSFDLDPGQASSSTSAVSSSSNIPSSSSAPTPAPGRDTPSSASGRIDLIETLDCMRILLAPVAARQRQKAERAAAEKAAGGNKKKPLNINIPLHGPRVEIVLAWLGAVHLVELEDAA